VPGNCQALLQYIVTYFTLLQQISESKKMRLKFIKTTKTKSDIEIVAVSIWKWQQYVVFLEHNKN
jgi:hypothetical protein